MSFFSLLSKTRRFTKAADRYWPAVREAHDLDAAMRARGDAALREVVGQHKGKSLPELEKATVEIFAAIREASRRVLQMRHFDVQLLGGLALLDGVIAEMKTGEGKTLVATLPLIFRALTGTGAHLVTVNDYLAARDAAWMSPLYEFFGLTVGVSVPGKTAAEKRAAYAADITYATNNEVGFDYLRDNMAQRPEDMAQRSLGYAIVDEVDSILIDEARTPLIISAPDAESTQLYSRFARLVPQLAENTHYNIDEKRRAVTLTDEGVGKVEELLGLSNMYEEGGIRFVHHLEQALRAHNLYRRDKDYVVKDGAVVIVDEFTGRLMEGRRYAEGLHQAIEAKEGVRVQQESRTLATITFQNFFRLYDTLAGMTGTAVTSAEEFEKVYNMEVVVVPTHRPMIRQDKPDRIYGTEAAKFAAAVNEIRARHQQGQPVLVGTIAIEKSERLAALLKRDGIPHEVLNAKNHAREAEIIAKAGHKGGVTISTNMAGRGTDIKLGAGVAETGGLFVLGTERHEARRIDNQLRGRSGRQGDPGATQFFVSLEDDVMRIFGGEKIRNVMQRLKVPADEPIENRLVNRALEGAQERVEGYYFDMRKQVLAYDDVLNRQRTAIYTLRRAILLERAWRDQSGSTALAEKIEQLLKNFGEELVALHTASDRAVEWDGKEIVQSIHALAGVHDATLQAAIEESQVAAEREGPDVGRQRLKTVVQTVLHEQLAARATQFNEGQFAALMQAAALRSIDLHWMDHLDTMDYLRTGIGLRGYGQRDPLVEYQKESYRLFQNLMQTIVTSLLETIFHAQSTVAVSPRVAPAPAATVRTTSKTTSKQVSRNDPCPCGSGRKYKKCHGA
ncbi:MAG TPA: preprotein translocase subunit SecA [Candidatus Andersenbacteria bacterium]|nr:MAG: preprotein translocase subunit SecA [Parcubacteria group bacterium RIFCSPHIGHO2_01_FULL_56_18]HLD26158.1 preprotein translocase subunit SecA [Candidatus Andersenbacteria bacterium]